MIELRPRACARRALAIAVAGLGFLLPFAAAGEARLGSKGDVLRGKVVDLTSDGVEFELVQGKGTIKVPWEDVESLETDQAMIVMYGDEGQTRGRILALENGAILVGADHASAERIEVSTLFGTENVEEYESSLRERLRSRLRYWNASLNAGASYTDATTDTVLGTVGLRVERDKDPTNLLIEGEARYGNQKDQGEDREITDGVAWGFVRGEYDFTRRYYAYLSNRATYDDLQNLSLRLEPRGGGGIHIVNSEKFNLSTDIGLAWVYENYFGNEDIAPGLTRSRRSQNFWAIAFGVQADAELPYGIKWRARGDYLPAVDNWADDYLLRGQTSLDVPLLDWMSFRLSIIDEYTSTAPDDTQRNRFTSTAGLAFGFP